MPAVNENQRKLFGMVLAEKRGKFKNHSSKVKNISSHMGDGDAKEFAQKKKRHGVTKSIMTGKSGY